MKVTSERIPESQILLEIELDDERVTKSLNQAAQRLSQRYRIPGFRKGKAPRVVIEQTLGADAVFEEAIERMIPQAYEQAIKEEGIAPIGPPEVESVDRDPVRIRARVPMPPEIDLGPYRDIALVEEPVSVTEEDVENAILEVRRQHAIIEPVDRPAGLNDRIKADIHATIDGQQVLERSDAEFHLREGMVIGIPGVVDEVVGLPVGEHTFSVDVADDWDDEDVAGRTTVFTVNIKEIKQEILPDADDALASEAGDFETFAGLRYRLEEDLRSGAEKRSRAEHHAALMRAVLDGASIEFPPLLVQHQMNLMLQEIAQSTGQDPQELLRAQDERAQQMREHLRDEAGERVRSSLVLEHLAEAESIEVTDADVDAEIARVAGDGPQAEQVREMLDTPDGRAMMRRNLTNTRLMDRLSEIARDNALAPEADAEATDATEAADDTEVVEAAESAEDTDATENAEATEDPASATQAAEAPASASAE